MNSLAVGDLTSFYSVSEEDHKTNTNGFSFRHASGNVYFPF